MDQVYVQNISWFTVIISDSVLQWKLILLHTLKYFFTKLKVCKNDKATHFYHRK